MAKSKLLNDEFQELVIREEAEMIEKLSIISENLVWLTNEVKDTKVLVLRKPKEEVSGQTSFDFQGNISSFEDKLEEHGNVLDTEASEMVYRGDQNRFVVVQDGLGMKVIPTFHTAQLGLLTRRGCNCPAITGNYAIKRPIPSIEEAFLNDSASRCKVEEKWGLLDGGAIANVSVNYVPLDAKQGFEVFKKEIENCWNVKFEIGKLSYEYYMADFQIKDEIALDGLKNTLEEMDIKVESLKAYARYSTSDSGNAAMSATIVYELNGSPLFLNNKLGVEHKGEVNIATFRDKVQDLGMLLKEAEEAVERLGNTELENAHTCLVNALKKVSLYNKYGKQEVDNLVLANTYSALDIIIICNDVLSATAKAEKWSVNQVMDASEKVARLLNSNFQKLQK